MWVLKSRLTLTFWFVALEDRLSVVSNMLSMCVSPHHEICEKAASNYIHTYIHRHIDTYMCVYILNSYCRTRLIIQVFKYGFLTLRGM